jgi:hypothetical protein
MALEVAVKGKTEVLEALLEALNSIRLGGALKVQ